MSHQEIVKFLIVEDNPGDAFLLQEFLEEIFPKANIHQAITLEKAKALLIRNHRFDAIFLDLKLPDSEGEPLVQEIIHCAEFTPVIVLTGNSNKDFGIKTLALGVADYLSKNELDVIQLTKSITYSIERKRIEHSLLKSNERFEIVSKATSDTIWDWDIEAKTVSSNQGIVRVFGYAEQDFEQTEVWWRSKIHPDDYRKVIRALTASFLKGTSLLKLEYRFRCADGTYKYVLDRAFLVLDDHKKPMRMIGAMQDITEKKKEELRLRLLESVVTQATDAVLITEAEPLDGNGPKIVYVNAAFTAMTGYKSEEVIGKTPRILQGPKTDRTELDRLKTALTNWESCTIEVINYTKEGKEFWINMTIVPVADSKGWYTHWIAIERDVTELKNYLLAIEEQNKKLRDIAWTQSHLVRAPLARIMGLVNLLSDEEDEHAPNDLLNHVALIKHIATSAEELDGIIRDIVKNTENV